MLAQIFLGNFEIGIAITVILSVIGVFAGLVVYIFNSKTNAIETRVDGLEKKMEPIPVMQEKLENIEKIDFLDFPTKDDICELKDQMRELLGQIKIIEQESDSIVREAPDKYQTRVQCTQNMNNIEHLITNFIKTQQRQHTEDKREKQARRNHEQEALNALSKKVDQILLMGWKK